MRWRHGRTWTAAVSTSAGRRRRLDKPALLPFVRQPTLILAGIDDPIIPLVNAGIMADYSPTPVLAALKVTWSSRVHRAMPSLG